MKPIQKKFFIALGLLWGFSVLALGGIHFVLLEPQQEALRVRESELAEAREEYRKCEDIGRSKVRRTWEERIKQLGRDVGNYVANPEELDKLAFGISRIGMEVGVKSFVSEVIGEESYSVMPNYEYIGVSNTSVEFDGTFTQLARFINLLERFRPVIFVDEFTIRRLRSEGNEHKVEMLFNVFVRMESEDIEEVFDDAEDPLLDI